MLNNEHSLTIYIFILLQLYLRITLFYCRLTEVKHSSNEDFFQPRLVNAKHHHLIDWSNEQVCLVVISTSGDGMTFKNTEGGVFHVNFNNILVLSISYTFDLWSLRGIFSVSTDLLWYWNYRSVWRDVTDKNVSFEGQTFSLISQLVLSL